MRARKHGLVFFAMLLVFALLALFVNDLINQKVFITEYTYANEKIPDAFDGFKIMVISDLHEAPFKEQIISHIKQEQPDIITILGDIIQLPNDTFREALEIAWAAYGMEIPAYAVSGNHERQSGRYEEVCEILWGADVYMLENGSVTIEKDGESILLVGIKDPKHDVVSETKIKNIRGNIQYELSRREEMFSILLSHRADLYPVEKDTGVDLILSGHIHGGIVRVPFLGGLIGHENGETILFPKYDYGVFEEEGAATMIVSGGCDKNPEKRRYFNPPEVLLITLEAE